MIYIYIYCKLIDIKFFNLKAKINDQYFTLFPWKKVCLNIKYVSFAFYSHLEIDPNKYQNFENKDY
jgi:hypothetical protein